MNAMSCCGGPAAHRDTGGAVAGVSGAWARVEARLARFGAVWLIGSAGLPILYPVPEDGGAAVPAEPSPLVAPAILSFTAAPDAILPGDVTVLRWKTSGAVLLRLDPGVGLVQGTAKTLRPAETTRFKLTATSAAGVMVSAEATVRVARGPIVAEFGVPPAPRRVVTPTMFGISYSVPGFGTIWSGSHYRGRFIRAAADRDFALMASLHVETVKLYYGPDSGLVYLKDGGARLRTAANDPDWPYYDDAVAFAPEIFRRATDLGMRPTLCFMTNEIYTTGPNGMYYNGGPTWYEYAYLHGPGPARMARDIAAWEKGLVDALLASPVCDQIYYINLATELGYAHIGAEGVTISDAQVDGLPQAVKVPAARRAMDALTGQINPATGHFIYDVADIRLAARARLRRTPLAITEVHDYPDLYKDSPGATLPGIVSPALVESTTRASVALTRQLFAAANAPGVTTAVVIGEASAAYVYFRTEKAQADAFEALWRGAQGAKAFYYGWGFWDVLPRNSKYGSDASRFGFGFSPDEPRDILGRAVELRSDLAGGDFERGVEGWKAGSAAAGAARLGWHGGDDAATGGHCLRLEITKPGLAWLRSPAFGVSGRRAALSAYVRTNAPSLAANLYPYRRGTGWSAVPLVHNVGATPAAIEAALGVYSWTVPPELPAYFNRADPWHFYQLQNLTPGFYFDLPAGTSGAVLCFWTVAPAGTGASHPVYLDLDTVAIHAFDPLPGAANR